MRSPFPGMDPYIEAQESWPDFHHKLIADLDRAISALLPDGYRCRMDERAYIVLAGIDEKDESEMLPDIGIVGPDAPRKKRRAASTEASDGGVTVVPFIEEQYRETFIEISLRRPEPQLVACVEVLSASNKRRGSEGWDQYVKKRNAMLLGSAHFIEIDLLLGGSRMPMMGTWPDSPYYVMLCRKPSAPTCRVWRASYREPLPSVRIPLAQRDPDLVIPLQPLVDEIYARSRYWLDLDYSRPVGLGITSGDAEWMRERITALREKSRKRGAP